MAVTRDVQTTVHASTYYDRVQISVGVQTMSTQGWLAPAQTRRNVEAQKGIAIADLRVMPAVRGVITAE